MSAGLVPSRHSYMVDRLSPSTGESTASPCSSSRTGRSRWSESLFSQLSIRHISSLGRSLESLQPAASGSTPVCAAIGTEHNKTYKRRFMVEGIPRSHRQTGLPSLGLLRNSLVGYTEPRVGERLFLAIHRQPLPNSSPSVRASRLRPT